MIKIDKLEPYDVYRTRPPVIMNEDPKNRRKFQAFMVIAPSIEQEMKYLMNNRVLTFRSLTKYFIEKRWDHVFHGLGKQIIKPNDDGQVTMLLDTYHTGNMKGITDVTSYLPNVKSRPLKNFNCLVECNHVTSAIMDNPKDKRVYSIKVRECLAEYTRIYNSAQKGKANNYLGEYDVNLIIPMELWCTKDDYFQPTVLMKKTSKNFMGQFLSMLCDPTVLGRFGKVYIVHDNYILILDGNNLPEDSESIKALITEFMVKARRSIKATEPDPDEKPEVTAKLKAAEKETKLELATEKVITAANKDPDETSAEKKQEVKRVVKKNIEKAEKAKTEVKKVADKSVIATPAPVKEEPEDDLFELEEDFPEVTIEDPKEVDILLAAKSQGKTVASLQRDQMLKEKYTELSIGNKTIKQITESEKKFSVPEVKVQAHTVNDDMKQIKGVKFEEAYNENVMLQDLTNILLHFSHVQPAMYLTKDIEVQDVSTPTDRIVRYVVHFEDENRKRHKIAFKLPKMYEDKYLYLNDQKMNISHQKLPYPVTKVSPEKCQAVTNYKKIFTERYGSNLSPRISKIKKIFTADPTPRIAKIVSGDSTLLNKPYLTTVEFDEIGSVMTKLDLGKVGDRITFYFIIDDAMAVIDTSKLNKIKFENQEDITMILPLAVHKKGDSTTYYYFSGKTNCVYDDKGKYHGELSEFITEAVSWYDDKLQKEITTSAPGARYVYSRSIIMKTDVPTVLLCAAADPGGLTAVLEKAKIKYQFLEKKPSDLDNDKYGTVHFSDGWFIYERYPYENSLLLNGLNTFPTINYSFYDLNTYEGFVDIFDTMFGKRYLIDAMRNFYYMFIDPITMEVLVKLNMPTDFTRLMLFCNDVLADNTYQIDSDYTNSRIRSNEIIMAQLYVELAEAWGKYRTQQADTFSIPEDCIIKYLLTSNIVDPHSELSVVLQMENDRTIQLKGPSGMNEEHSFTIEKRAFHPTMKGLVGMNSTPSGKVGIGRHMTLNPNIDDARGFITINKEEYSGTELATPGELMHAFGPESSDIERVAMAISQSKHVIPVAENDCSPVSYDMERIVPYIATDFAKVAKKRGNVQSITNDIMIIHYDDGTYEDVDLSKRPARNTDGGFYIMNQMMTKLKVGDSVEAGQIVAYDPKYFNENDMFGDPLANLGTLAKVAIETNGGVYEDSCYITDELAHKIATKITRQKRVILTKYANVKFMAKEGSNIYANDPLLVFDDTKDEFTSTLLQALAQESGDEDEVIASNAPVISKLTGKIADVRIYYTADLAEMTPSLRAIVEEYNTKAQKREKTLSKYENIYDANTVVKTSERLIPDSQGKIKGAKVPDGVMIDFYIEYEDIAAPGDKISYLTRIGT